MEMVLLTALGVGSATVFGSLLGFAFKKLSHKFSDIVLSFAAGVMMAAAVLGLILPSIDYGGDWGLLITVVGIFAGALCLNLIDRLVPHLHKLAGADIESICNAIQTLPGCPDDIRAQLSAFVDQLLEKEILVPAESTGAVCTIEASSLSDGFKLTVDEFAEVQDLILADPVHDVDVEQGWPILNQ